MPIPHTVGRRIGAAMTGTSRLTYGPTPTHLRTLEIAEQELGEIGTTLRTIVEQRLPELERRLRDAGAPWAVGAELPRM